MSGRNWLRLLAVGLVTGVVLVSCGTPEVKTLANDEQRESYAMGVDMGSYLVDLPFTLDEAAFLQGVRDTLAGAGLLISADEVQELVSSVRQEISKVRMDRAKEESMAQAAAGKEYLEKNGKKDGVTTTDSGLQYEVITMGDGPKPKASDMVTVHYEGMLIDGSVFDSSVERGEPASFPLNGVIRGWTEGLQLMPVGSKFRFTIPSELGYGERGAGNVIPGGSVLIFDVELLGIGE